LTERCRFAFTKYLFQTINIFVYWTADKECQYNFTLNVAWCMLVHADLKF